MPETKRNNLFTIILLKKGKEKAQAEKIGQRMKACLMLTLSRFLKQPQLKNLPCNSNFHFTWTPL